MAVAAAVAAPAGGASLTAPFLAAVGELVVAALAGLLLPPSGVGEADAGLSFFFAGLALPFAGLEELTAGLLLGDLSATLVGVGGVTLGGSGSGSKGSSLGSGVTLDLGI